MLIKIIVHPLRRVELMSVSARNAKKLGNGLLKHRECCCARANPQSQAQRRSYKGIIRFLTTKLGDILLDLLVCSIVCVPGFADL